MHMLTALCVAVFFTISALPAVAQQTDPADLLFWESIKNSSNPAEYQAYLQAFPTGRFAGLAQLRAQGGPLPAPAAQTGAPVPPMPGGNAGPAPMAAPAAGAPAAAPPGMAADLPPDTAPQVGNGRFQFTMEEPIVSLGAKARIKVANVPSTVKLNYAVMVAGTSLPNWRAGGANRLQTGEFIYFHHDRDPSGPNKYLDTGTLELYPVPMGDYWVRFYSDVFTGTDALVGSVSFRVQ